MIIYKLYKIVSYLIAPIIPIYLLYRLFIGKETFGSFKEKLFYTDIKRPKGKLLWFHAASIGEVKSIIPLIREFAKDYPILVTTITINSAKVLKKENLNNVIHRFLPPDIPFSVKSFLRHWKPDLIVFVDSELWPNFITYISKFRKPFINLNGRLSDKSFSGWSRVRSFASYLYNSFDMIIASSNNDVAKITNFVDPLKIRFFGNLKYSNCRMTYDESEYKNIQKHIGDRHVWVAAGTHKGEDESIISAHKELINKFENLLLIIVPRHPERGKNIEKIAQNFNLTTSLRSRNDNINEHTEIYIADTIGELGIWYKISEISFVGGSLVPHGGHNILEPASSGNVIIVGKHTHNFKDIIASFKKSDALLEINNSVELMNSVAKILTNVKYRNKLKKSALLQMKKHSRIFDEILETLTAFIVSKR
jgi:3-deoxy-D-manno-octulosonic-acid transferase